MKKFNCTVFERLSLQAEEAREQGMLKLAEGIESALLTGSEESASEYSSDEMEVDVYKDLFAAAANVIKHYNSAHVDVDKLDLFLEEVTHKFAEDVKEVLDISSVVGPREPKLPGETK